MNATDSRRESGLRLRQAIEGLGLRPGQAASMMGASPSKLSNWMRGTHVPDIYTLARFCDATGLTLDWIFRGILPGAAVPAAESQETASAAFQAASPAAARRASGASSSSPVPRPNLARTPSRRNVIKSP